MTAGFRPTDIVLAPNGRTHRLRHDGIVAGGKGEHGTVELCARLGLVPVHEPAEALIEPLDIERLRPGESLGSAAAPGRNGGTEPIEALDAGEAAERRVDRLPCPVKQPEQAEGMADSDALAWPCSCRLRSTGDEAQIDEAHLGIPHISDQV